MSSSFGIFKLGDKINKENEEISDFSVLTDGRIIITSVNKIKRKGTILRIYDVNSRSPKLIFSTKISEIDIFNIVEIPGRRNRILINGMSRSVSGILDLETSKIQDLELLVVKAVATKGTSRRESKILNCILVSRLNSRLPRDLINETFKFF